MNEPADDARLLVLAAAVADGFDVDWTSAEASASSPAQRDVIRQLCALAAVVGSQSASIAAVEESVPSSAERWGPLALHEEVGRGTFGTVFRAWDLRLDREVALKLLHRAASAPPSVISAIIEEGRLIARVRHPNVVTIYGAERFDERVGLWMEFIHGKTLKDLLVERGSFGAREAILIGIDLCGALAAVHRAGLVHRDVKAQNVMREDGGRIVLMDFGAGAEALPTEPHARATFTGTPLYMAPELLHGAEASALSDTYSVGVLLFHLVTNRFPVSGATLDEIRLAHERKEAVHLRDLRPDLPASFVRVVEQATSVALSERFGSAGAMERALDRALGSTAISPDSVLHGGDPRNEAGVLPRPRRYTRFAIGTLALFGLVGALVLARPFIGRAPRPAPITGASLTRIDSIAVLPFRETGEPSEKYLANAVPMELTRRLAQIDQFKTIPWTFVKEIADKSKSVKDLVASTGADGIVEGAVQLVPAVGAKAEQRVRISVQLYDGRTGALIWSQPFEDDIGQFISINTRIADEVAQRIRTKLELRREVTSPRFRSISPDAMELYLRGRDLMRANGSPEQLQQALDYFTLATQKDVSFPQAYSEVAECNLLLAGYWHKLSPKQGYPKVLEAASRAMALDQSLGSAWAARAYAKYMFGWDWDGAEADFNRALMNPVDNDQIVTWHAEYLTAMGRHKEAVAATDGLVAAIPQSTHARRQAAWSRFFARDYDGAIEHLREALRLDPTLVSARTLLGRAYLQKGLYAEGIRELELVEAGDENQRFRPMLAHAYAVAGRKADAEGALAAYLSAVRTDRADYDVALVHVAMGRADRAVHLLEKVFARKDTSMVMVNVDPRLDQMRGTPRFDALVRQMRFPRTN